MVRDALDAFARFDADLALSVAQYDKTIDVNTRQPCASW